MIILPPEEKKSSPILKWIFRILLIGVVVSGILIFALNILSGTSDAHRKGLEQALSDIFQTNVTIGSLKAFNIFPLFNVEFENVRGPYGPNAGEVRAGNVVLTFRFFDLLFSRDLVKDIQIRNLTVTPGIIGAHGLTITSAGIVPVKVAGERPTFNVEGVYGGLPIKGSLELEMVGGIQPVYRIKNDLPAQVNFGKIGISGNFVQNENGEPSIQNAKFMFEDKEVAKGAFTLLTSNPKSEFQIDFITPHSQGSLITHNEPKSQIWNFEKLDLVDVIADAPVWAGISNAFSEISPPTTSQGGIQSDLVTIEIKSLTGDLSAQGLRGTFISTPNKFTGWWDGTITTASVQKKDVPAAGKVQCGLLSLFPKSSSWSTDSALVLIDPASLLAKVAVDTTSGAIKWSIERVATGTPNIFNTDLSAYAASKQELNFPSGHPCLSYIEEVSTP